ncbi:MAG: NADH-quinone oxidoreductase subunit NuoE [Candidatus Cloacimonadota bacterium]|jgi:NADH-quinone oxidoreductase subunit E|nr:NADH-quinone oxidoreductase subunit NuoE [Candidatus Cloacimonas sp.]MDD5408105.1 NADH-quinone oxidoreductase subunit NuoE [Candidatus Cloacimonas acidaminovorans]MDI9572772.1 NADH-quinone oxidoreductase subunit NuoE [Candidatus Cloacimonadota bacterium]OQC72537.1 MAG: NADP-reducing hydrogenase subunit HndA [Candidatus Cloacimonetes bacterium ADurb.Bin003]NLM90381.1 NADH-quinone oxidoreductase subunit NuoE [Candidatus Cloacimonadota bacterium]
MKNTYPELDKILAKYQDKKGALIPLLQEVQKEKGYLSRETMQYLADKMKIPPAEIFGVATFYSMFRLKPQGKHLIRVCKGTACHVSDADGIKKAVMDALQLSEEENTTADMQFTVMEVACLGCCSLSPVIMIDGRTYGKLTPGAIPAVLKQYEIEDTL